MIILHNWGPHDISVIILIYTTDIKIIFGATGPYYLNDKTAPCKHCLC